MISFFIVIFLAVISLLNLLAINGQLFQPLNDYLIEGFKAPEAIFGAKAEQAPSLSIDDHRLFLRESAEPFILSASSGLALDVESGVYLFEKDADRQMSIASISKLMSALVFLDHNPGWHEIYVITAADKREGSRLNFFPGEQVYIRDLFYSALVASDNAAIVSLVRASGLAEDEFTAAMNDKAMALGMTNTKFAEPTGLSDDNLATARDVAKLIMFSMQDLDIRRAVLADQYELEILNAGIKQQKKRIIKNTDQLLRETAHDTVIIGGKTGFLHKAGYCFAGSFEKHNRQIVTVVLGAADNNARFQETARLLNWVFDNYNFPTN